MPTRARLRCVTLLLVALATPLAACGGSDDESNASAKPTGSTAAKAGSPPSGEPIKIGNIVPVGGQVNYPDIVASAKAAVRGINARGGVNGHPLELITCNEGNSPNTASACARKLIKEKVVAEVAALTLTAEQQLSTILGGAGIPMVGDAVLTSVLSNDDNEFLTVSPSSVWVPASVKTCVDAGKKKIGLSILDLPGPQEKIPVIKQAAEVAGAEVVAEVSTPLSTTDFTPGVQKLVGAGVECIVPALLNTQSIGTMKALQQLGSDALQAVTTGSFDAKDWKTTPKPENVIANSPFPVPTDTEKFPVFKQFQEDMKAERDAGNQDAPYNDPFARSPAVNAWFAVNAVAKTIEKFKPELTAAGVKAALQKVDGLDIGLPRPWSPNDPGPKGFSRVSTAYLYSLRYEDGTLVLLDEEPFDAMQLLK